MEPLAKFLALVNEQIINPLLALLFLSALAYFFWGLMLFAKNAASTEGREIGRRHMLWGIIGLFCMTAVYLILQMALATFRLDDDVPERVPLQNIV